MKSSSVVGKKHVTSSQSRSKIKSSAVTESQGSRYHSSIAKKQSHSKSSAQNTKSTMSVARPHSSKPLSNSNRQQMTSHGLSNDTMKESKLQSSQRRKIQSHLDSKQSYLVVDKPMSFRKKQADKENHLQINRRTHSANENSDKVAQQNKELKELYFRAQQASLEDKEKIKMLISRISELKREKSSHPQESSSKLGMNKGAKVTASYAQLLSKRNPQNQFQKSGLNQDNISSATPVRNLGFSHGRPNISTSQSKYGLKSNQKQSCGNPKCDERKRYLQNELYKERLRRDELQQEKKEWEVNKQNLKRQYRDLLNEIQCLREDANAQDQSL